ncbi:Prolipoprotein diacylglyceryl transferase [Lysobacter dokdonensis DS-58]|uniref:Prolipoprotein diacylglyceryl transferase n=1 Tax=Lysobacter dokdonensis DS-58 TaxID=1300345 RepID=A0A0A2WKI6_9GAMM|nr:Prolipoprotein diacylglyceryl transferase [Lysobacter dokdonensis DS-58]
MRPDLQLAYSGMVLLGLILLLVFRPAGHYGSVERKQYWRLQFITLFAALIGAKFAVLMGDGRWPLVPFHDWIGLLLSGRSIVGALLFGFLAAEAAKPLLRYPLPPNDRFALLLPFSIATGRMGCWMAGCCVGIESDGPIALVGVDGVSRIPAPLIEMAFHLACGVLLIVLFRARSLQGRLFALYLVVYGAFRIVSEYWRVTPKDFGGWSAYQWMALAMILAGGVALYARRGSGIIAARPAGGTA